MGFVRANRSTITVPSSLSLGIALLFLNTIGSAEVPAIFRLLPHYGESGEAQAIRSSSNAGSTAVDSKREKHIQLTGDIVLVSGFHHSGTTLLRHMLGNGRGAVEHPPDDASTGLVPCKWLGALSSAAEAQKCGNQVGKALSKYIPRKGSVKRLPVVVAKKTGNAFHGFGATIGLISSAGKVTIDSTSYENYSIGWKVKQLILEIRDPLDSVWSVFKREYGADEFDRAFECLPCAVRSHFRRAWTVLREHALLAMRDDSLRRAILPFSPHVNRHIDANESCDSFAAQAARPNATLSSGTGWCWGRARRYIPEDRQTTTDGFKSMCRLQKAEMSKSVDAALPAFVVQYESLVRDPKATVVSILAHLRSRGIRIGYSDAMVNTTAKPLKQTNIGSKFEQMTQEELQEMAKQQQGDYKAFNRLRASQVNRPIGAQRVSAWQRENSEERQELLARLNLEAAIAAGVVPTEGGGSMEGGCVAPVSLDLASMSRAEVIEKSKEVYQVFAQAMLNGRPPLQCLQQAGGASSTRPDGCDESIGRGVGGTGQLGAGGGSLFVD